MVQGQHHRSTIKRDARIEGTAPPLRHESSHARCRRARRSARSRRSTLRTAGGDREQASRSAPLGAVHWSSRAACSDASLVAPDPSFRTRTGSKLLQVRRARSDVRSPPTATPRNLRPTSPSRLRQQLRYADRRHRSSRCKSPRASCRPCSDPGRRGPRSKMDQDISARR